MTHGNTLLVFLRILEYYSGVLFLTTNRVGIIDEAFKSRIHISLYYPPLNRTQTRQIFELNIKRLEEIERSSSARTSDPKLEIDKSSILEWAETHFDNNPEHVGRWNGRQIRNAFQIAASLGRYDLSNKDPSQTGLDGGKKPGYLNAVHFQTVAKATKEFDLYMVNARKGTDAEIAQKENTRYSEKIPPTVAYNTPSRRNDPRPLGPLPHGNAYQPTNPPSAYSPPQVGPQDYDYAPLAQEYRQTSRLESRDYEPGARGHEYRQPHLEDYHPTRGQDHRQPPLEGYNPVRPRVEEYRRSPSPHYVYPEDSRRPRLPPAPENYKSSQWDRTGPPPDTQPAPSDPSLSVGYRPVQE